MELLRRSLTIPAAAVVLALAMAGPSAAVALPAVDEEVPPPEPTACDAFATHGACVSDAATELYLPGLLHGACVNAYARVNPGLTEDPVDEDGSTDGTESDETGDDADPGEELPPPDPTACDAFATHGACVSGASHDLCPPGPLHGLCVRAYAHLNHGQTKDLPDADEPADDGDEPTDPIETLGASPARGHAGDHARTDHGPKHPKAHEHKSDGQRGHGRHH